MNSLVIQYSTKNIPKDKKPKRMEILHPFFLSAIPYCNDDVFWIKILDNASKGIFPKLYKYLNNVLAYRQKANKYVSVELDQSSPEQLFRTLQNFMKRNGTYSMRDENERVKEVETKDDIINSWSDIKSRKMKRLLLSKYVIHLKSHYNLSNDEVVNLNTLISASNATGIIKSNNVVITDGRISDVTILCFDPRSRNFFIDSDVKIEQISKSQLNKINEENSDLTPVAAEKKTNLNNWGKFVAYLIEKNKLNDRYYPT